MVLLSEKERRAADDLVARIRYMELSRQPGFATRFARCQWFPQEEQ